MMIMKVMMMAISWYDNNGDDSDDSDVNDGDDVNDDEKY